jgi:hypothetical protein
MKTKTKRAPKAWDCECNRPKTSHDVRRMEVCTMCQTPGLELVPWGRHRVHPRCLVARIGLRRAAREPAFVRRAGLCCLGPAGMKRLVKLAKEGAR